MPISLRYIANTWGLFQETIYIDLLQSILPLQYLKEMGNDLKLPAAVPSHCTVHGTSSSKKDVIGMAILTRGCHGSTY